MGSSTASTVFKPNHKKLGGRKKGTPNKKTIEDKMRIESFLNNKWEEFETEIWANLTAKDKKDTIIAMLNYRYPKLQSIGVNGTVKTEQGALDKLRSMVNDPDIV